MQGLGHPLQDAEQRHRLGGSPATWDGRVGWKARHMAALGTSTTADGCWGLRPRRSKFQAHTKDHILYGDRSGSVYIRKINFSPSLREEKGDSCPSPV